MLRIKICTDFSRLNADSFGNAGPISRKVKSTHKNGKSEKISGLEELDVLF